MPAKHQKIPIAELERRWLALIEPQPSSCWLWTGRKNVKGYGQFGPLLAHRFGVELVRGKIPKGLELDHICNNRACVNPSHLEAVTHKENCRRASERRGVCPNGHPYTEEHSIPNHKTGGRRGCRTCRKEYMRQKRIEKLETRN